MKIYAKSAQEVASTQKPFVRNSVGYHKKNQGIASGIQVQRVIEEQSLVRLDHRALFL